MSNSPLTKEQYDIVVAHVRKFHNPLVCPFCKTADQWSVEPIGVVPDYGPGTLEGKPYNPQSGRMYVALSCRVCFFTYHFAWLPMKRESEALKKEDDNVSPT